MLVIPWPFVEPQTSFRSPRPQDPLTAGIRLPQKRDRYWLHLLLFLLTLASTIYAGGSFAGRILRYEEMGVWWFVPDGLLFGFSLLLFLSVHEFGHYFAARYHGISTSLPYYIPAPIVFTGTLGAIIRIREPIPSIKKLFDIGAAGPIAGFVVALGLLLFGLATLPSPAYLFDLTGHEEIKAFIEQNGRFPDTIPTGNPEEGSMNLIVGHTLLYWGLSQFFENVPPMYEIYHYPVLWAGWLGLFFTALNLLPVGQLDGGHILYALVGRKWHALLARLFVLLLLISGAIGFVNDFFPSLRAYNEVLGSLSWFILATILYFFLNRVFEGDHRLIAPTLLAIMAIVAIAGVIGPAAMSFGYSGWLFFGLLIVLFIKIDHPPVLYYAPLTPGRRSLAMLAMLIFVLCFSIRPIHVG